MIILIQDLSMDKISLVFCLKPCKSCPAGASDVEIYEPMQQE